MSDQDDFEAAAQMQPRRASPQTKVVSDGMWWDRSGDRWMSGAQFLDFVRSEIRQAIAAERRRSDKVMEGVINGAAKAMKVERDRHQAELDGLKREIGELKAAAPLRAIGGGRGAA